MLDICRWRGTTKWGVLSPAVQMDVVVLRSTKSWVRWTWVQNRLKVYRGLIRDFCLPLVPQNGFSPDAGVLIVILKPDCPSGVSTKACRSAVTENPESSQVLCLQKNLKYVRFLRLTLLWSSKRSSSRFWLKNQWWRVGLELWRECSWSMLEECKKDLLKDLKAFWWKNNGMYEETESRNWEHWVGLGLYML